MMRMGLGLSAMLGLFSCGDETLSGYGAADTKWVLTEVDGTAFAARAILTFPEEGRIQGQAPCNTFSGAQTVPYPWFKAEGVAVTRMACPDLPAENVFFDALQAMTLAEVGPDTLLLSNDDGRKMVFRAEN
ncbi:MAG: META domain-containing protein [Pseudomonadota bacterium]